MLNQHANSNMPKHSHCHNTVARTTTTTTKDATGNAESDIGEVEISTIRDVGSRILSSSRSFSLLHDMSELVIEDNNKQQTSGLLTDNLPTSEQWVTVTSDLACSPSLVLNWEASENKENPHKPYSVTCEGRKEIVTRDKSQYWNIPNDFDSDNLTKICGKDTVPVNVCEYRTLKRLPEAMQKNKCDLEVPNIMKGTGEAGHELLGAKRDESTKAAKEARPFRNQWQFQASAGTLLQVRASHLLKLTFMLILVIAVFSFVFHSRIKVLEEEKRMLLGEIGTLQMNVRMLVTRMEDVVNLIPPRSQRIYLDSLEEVIENRGNEEALLENGGSPSNTIRKVGEVAKKVVKRSAAASRTTKELLYASQSQSNELNNETTSSYGINDWSSINAGSQKSPKGMKDTSISSPKKMRRHRFRKQLRKLTKSHRLEINDLKQKLSQTQQQIFAAKNLSCCNHTLSSTLSLAESAYGAQHARSVYLQIDGSSVNIRKQRLELIGPWFLPQTGGDEIGFNSLWYNGLTLDSNGTSLIFKEDGLFLISAQVFYKLQQERNAKQDSMGYRIYLRKNGDKNKRFQRPLTLAECVPSFPKTMLQTCFTQVAWFIEANDEVYLEHCTEALPVIEALRNGQTFLSVVRL